MAKLLNKIPQLIKSKDSSSLDEYNFAITYPTKAVMQRNFSSLKELALAYKYDDTFNDVLSSITKPMTIEEFIEEISKRDNEVGYFLKDSALRINIAPESQDVAHLVWASCIIADITGEASEDVNNLFFSLSKSFIYKNISPIKMREEINDYFSNLTETFDLNASAIKNYLSAAFTSNKMAQSRWIDYSTFKEIEINKNLQLGGLQAVVNALENGTFDDYNAVYEYIKNEYLWNQPKASEGYCDNEYERDYKASIALSCLADALDIQEKDDYNSLGFNLLSRINSLPEALTEVHPLSQTTSIINRYDQEAEKLVESLLKGVLVFTTDNKTSLTNIAQAQREAVPEICENENFDDLNSYTKKQLSTFTKIADKKLQSLRETMHRLTKILTKKSKLAKSEEELELLAQEYKVELTTIDEQQNTTLRLLDNVTLLFDAVHDRYDEISRSKEVFKKLRDKMGTNLDITEESFDNTTIGDTSYIAKSYQEKIIKDFYKLVKTDPKLNLATKFRIKNDTFRMAELKERALLSSGFSDEFYSLLQAIKLTPSQREKYEEDKKLEIKHLNSQKQNEDFEFEIN
ncbi:MAG: hypothetical protein IJZ62_05390 [Clostridia bacterium]|nr:hypothetical protein [Clostridia bacterium]